MDPLALCARYWRLGARTVSPGVLTQSMSLASKSFRFAFYKHLRSRLEPNSNPTQPQKQGLGFATGLWLKASHVLVTGSSWQGASQSAPNSSHIPLDADLARFGLPGNSMQRFYEQQPISRKELKGTYKKRWLCKLLAPSPRPSSVHLAA